MGPLVTRYARPLGKTGTPERNLRLRTRALIKQVLAYGSLAAVLLVCLQLLRNSYLLYDLSLELYLLMAGAPLLIVGIVLGRHLDNRRSMTRGRRPPESEQKSTIQRL